MNGNSIQTARGIIVKIDFEGEGPGSGSLTIYLDSAIAFEVYMDTNRQKYFQLFAIACSAMWDRKAVEVDYSLQHGDDMAVDIREV